MDQPSLPNEEKAMRELLGEMRGESEICPRCVIGMLALPVVVHRPDFFAAGARRDEVNLRLGDAVEAAAKTQDDLVREAVGNLAGIFLLSHFVVLLAQNLRGLRVLGVEEPALDDDRCHCVTASEPKAPSRRSTAPPTTAQTDLLRRSRRTRRRHALRDHVEDAGVVQIVIERCVEGVLEGGVCGSVEAALKSATARRMRSTPRLVPV